MLKGIRVLWLVPSLAGLVALMAGPSVSQTIDFDDASDDQIINDFYAGLGVTFSCTACAATFNNPDGGGAFNVIATEPEDFTPVSAPNVVATGNEIDGDGCYSEVEEGIVRATFNPVVSDVSIRVLTDDDPPDDDVGWLRAYNSSDVLVDESFSSNLSGAGNSEIISVSGDISYVEFSGLDTNDTCFDDLAFGVGVPTIPGPWVLAMIGVLLLTSLYALRRRLSAG